MVRTQHHPKFVSAVANVCVAFFAGSQRFYIRGVDYQPGGSSDAADPMADTTVCKRDIAE